MTNYTKYRGDDVTLNLVFKDADGEEIDITLYTIYFTLKKNKFDSDAQAVLSKDVTVHTTPLEGETQIALTGAQTELFNGTYYYDISYLTGVGGTKKTVDSGAFTFKENISVR